MQLANVCIQIFFCVIIIWISFSAYDSFGHKQEKLNSYGRLAECTTDHLRINDDLFQVVNVAATYITQVRNIALAICSIDAIFLIFVLFMMLKTKIMQGDNSHDGDD